MHGVASRTIYVGNCIEIMRAAMDDESTALVYADPPYNLSGNSLQWLGNTTGGDWFKMNEEWDRMSPEAYRAFTGEWIGEAHRILKPNGSLYVSCTYHNVADVLLSVRELEMKVNNTITWYKPNAMPNMTKRLFTHCTEYVVWAVKGAKWVFNYEAMKEINPEKQKDGSDKQMRDLWTIPLVQGSERLHGENGRAAHPTQKPEEMLKRVVLASSSEGDLVVDPFLGSGTTAVVAERYKRRWLGIEAGKEYAEMAVKRFQDEFGTGLTLVDGDSKEKRIGAPRKRKLFDE